MQPTILSLNHAATVWSHVVFHATWQASVVAMAALLAVWLFRRWRAPLRGAVLLLALVKFMAPPMVSLPVGIFQLASPVTRPLAERVVAPVVSEKPIVVPMPVMRDFVTIGNGTARPPQPVSVPIKLKLTLLAWLMIAHLTGCAFVLAWVCLSLLRLRGLVKGATAQRDGRVYDGMIAMAARLNVRPPREVLMSEEPVPPMAFGLLRHRVMLPRTVVETLPAEQIDIVLAHELAHHRRHDALVTLLQLIVAAVWWFNPLAWMVGAELRRVREECCDDVVLGEGIAGGAAYCRTMLCAAEHSARSPLKRTLILAEPMHPLGGRMARIMDPALRRLPRLPRAALLAVLVVAAVVLPGVRSPAQSQQAAPQPTKNLSQNGIDSV